ncbi:MAG TPA: EamA family transporter [Candidatus Deferrimicrobiaceae bacterium]
MGRGAEFALLAALCFGATTPLIRIAGAGIGPWTTAALLYAGAALVSAFSRRRAGREAPLRLRHLPRLLLVAMAGAAFAPAALAWGLQRTGALGASLLLNAEVVFTILLAAALYREHIGRRVGAAALALALGGAFLVFERSTGGGTSALGLLAVLAATAGWAVDNVASRPLADFDPASVVLAKASLGAILTLSAAAAFGEGIPRLPAAAALAAIGVVGYGLSMRFYLLAQRRFGTARTSTYFASAPFIGAVLAMALGDRPGSFTWGGIALMLAGAWLLATERHDHPHFHAPLEHEHAHRHGRGSDHHGRSPAVPTQRERRHSHLHLHEAADHAHPHGPDLHHGHSHRKSEKHRDY